MTKHDRSKASVEILISALRAAHARYPDQRVGQLIVNVLPPAYENDAFFIENRDLAALLSEYAAIPRRATDGE